ncbi:MAG: cell division protein ZapA [Rickettsiales bacterium]
MAEFTIELGDASYTLRCNESDLPTAHRICDKLKKRFVAASGGKRHVNSAQCMALMLFRMEEELEEISDALNARGAGINADEALELLKNLHRRLEELAKRAGGAI